MNKKRFKNTIKPILIAIGITVFVVSILTLHGRQSKKNVLFKLHQEQYRKVMYYAKEATNSIPHDIERFNSYVDSTMMAGYAQDVLSDAWDKAGFKFK